MACDGGVSALQWGHSDPQVSITGSLDQSSVRQWLTSTIPQDDAKHEPPREAAGPLRRNPSGDDDLALGVEASLYGKQGVRTVQDFLRWSRKKPSLSRWNSISSAASGHSGPLSVMDILNLWNDDPEEFLLDLGFGCDEPDLSGRIPARFINYQSQARGINLQVFLEAQKSRMDLENPDVSNRFRQLEVLQQVTTAFSSLVGSTSSALKAKDLDKDMPPEARERRRRMGLLFRRASKKSLSQIHSQKALDLSSPDATTTSSSSSSSSAAPESLLPVPSLGDKKVPLKRLKPGHLETVGLSPLAEELVAAPDPQSQSHVVSFMTQDGTVRPGGLRDAYLPTATTLLQRKKNQWQGKESFEMEEIHSFDEGSLTGSYAAGAENIVRGLMRTNSCQSDSSGFLEEPYVPSLPLQGSPGSDLIKALAGLSGGSTDSHSSDRPSSPLPSYPHVSTSPPLSPSLNSSGAGDSFPQEPPTGFSPSPPPAATPPLKSDLLMSEAETSTDGNQSLAASPLHIDDQPPVPSSPPVQSVSSIQGSEEIDAYDQDPLCHHLSDAVSSHSPSPDVDSLFPFSTDTLSKSNSEPNTESLEEASDINPDSTSSGSSHLPPSVPSDLQSSPSTSPTPPMGHLSQSPSISQRDTPRSPTQTPPPPSEQLPLDEPSPKDCPASPHSALSSQSQDPDAVMDPAAGKMSAPAAASPVRGVIHVETDDVSSHLEETLQREGKGRGEAGDTEQTRGTDVNIPDTERSPGFSECPPSAFKEASTLTNPQIPQQAPRHRPQGELPAETKQEESGQVCKVEIKDTESKSHISPLRYNIVNESSPIRADLITIESLDSVFETSVDGSDFEGGEADAFFRQLDAEGQVFWAEPIQVSYSLEEIGSLEAPDGNPENSFVPEEPAGVDENASSPSEAATSEQDVNIASDSLEALTPAPSPATDAKSLSRSVSVQMSSSPSSHIVHRKDVPYLTDSKHPPPTGVLPLDTSTPFRAVQSWTDLHIQRNKNLSHEFLETIPNEAAYFTSAGERSRRQMFSSTPSFPLPSTDWQPHDSLAGKAGSYRTVSVSVDTGLSPREEKIADGYGSKEERKLWEDGQPTTAVCCCSCDRRCGCRSQKSHNEQQTVENIPYSLDELEEMMLCLQQFCSVLSNMEEQLSEDQAGVYGSLTDQDREKVRDIEELRRAVKHEAGELEKQLNDLAHHYDDSLKMKMHRLLDEQSLLCSQLRVFLPGALSATSNKTVATQCSLTPWIAAGRVQGDGPVTSWSAWKEDSSRVMAPGLDKICESLGSSPTKADKMDIVGFLQRLKESLHHSVNTDSLE